MVLVMIDHRGKLDGLGHTMFDDSTIFSCSWCGEPNEIDVDLSAGQRQVYVEDCQVCCRPNVLRVSFDADGLATVDAEPES